MNFQHHRLESNASAKSRIYSQLCSLGWNYHEVDYYDRTKVIEIFKISNIRHKKHIHVKNSEDGAHWPIHRKHSQTMLDNFYYMLTSSNSEDVYIIPSLDMCILAEEEHATYEKNCQTRGVEPDRESDRALRTILPAVLLETYRNNYSILEDRI